MKKIKINNVEKVYAREGRVGDNEGGRVKNKRDDDDSFLSYPTNSTVSLVHQSIIFFINFQSSRRRNRRKVN